MRNPRPYKFSQDLYFDDVISIVRIANNSDDPLQFVLVETIDSIDEILTDNYFDKYAYLFLPNDRLNIIAADGTLTATIAKLSETEIVIIQHTIQNQLILPELDTFLISSPHQGGKAVQVSAALPAGKYSRYYFSWDNENAHPPSAEFSEGIPLIFNTKLFFTTNIPTFDENHYGYLSVYDDDFVGWKQVISTVNDNGFGGFLIQVADLPPNVKYLKEFISDLVSDLALGEDQLEIEFPYPVLLDSLILTSKDAPGGNEIIVDGKIEGVSIFDINMMQIDIDQISSGSVIPTTKFIPAFTPIKFDVLSIGIAPRGRGVAIGIYFVRI